MNKFKSHLVFSKKQRNGIFLLILMIVVLQVTLLKVDFSQPTHQVDDSILSSYNSYIDSLKIEANENAKPEIYPFNPNYITDFKGYSLGMTAEEIDRLLKYRSQNKWVNSAQDFQKVTLISDSLLQKISPFFKFPDWVNNSEVNHSQSTKSNSVKFSDQPKSNSQKIDLNLATAAQLQKINGIGEKLSQRIVEFRERQPQGFIADIQLSEVYGLTPEVIEKITNHFTVKSPAQIIKININTATTDELVTIKYIGYEVAYNIIEARTLRDGFNSLDELTKVKDFPIQKLEIIKLYLTL